MGVIHVLDTELSNKIAAGEVVERPASVIKELVENSIDAGATSITVEIRDGGITYMRVTDNGSGMAREDAEIAFMRHATSKIMTDDDLDAIYTLGFRGEALSSIAAVARVDLFTKREQDEEGVLVHAEGGEITLSDSAGTPVGTTIVVKNLFFNTPARMKFLKKNSTEGGYIADIMSRFILAHPEISFKFINGNKEQLFSAGNNKLSDCIYTVYGRDYAKSTLDVDYENGGIHLSGAVGKGDVARPNRNFQSFFINGRYIKSPLIIRAVEEAYKNQIMIGKFPMAVLNLEIHPSLIDINVHPTKLEVKFSDEKLIYETVYWGVKNALYQTVHIPKIESKNDVEAIFNAPKKTDYSQMSFAPGQTTTQTAHNSEIQNLTATNSAQDVKTTNSAPNLPAGGPKTTNSAPNSGITDGKTGITTTNTAPNLSITDEKQEMKATDTAHNFDMQETEATNTAQETKPDFYKEAVSKPVENVFNLGLSAEPIKAAQERAEYDLTNKVDKSEENQVECEQFVAEEVEAESVQPEEQMQKAEEYVPDYRIVGQVFDTYIIAERDDEMLIIDQHAAHERLKYEALKKRCSEGTIAPQILLFPTVVTLSATEFAVYCENRDFLLGLGFETDEFGDNEIIVRTIPMDMDEQQIIELIVELLSQLEGSKRELISAKEDRAMYTVACKAAIKANHRLHPDEMKSLLDDVFRLPNINTCPHGRPIIVSMTKKELEKEFKRIV